MSPIDATLFPAGRKFAFTILDDTDDSTLANVAPLYDLLYDLGLRTTKTVWPLDCPEGSRTFFAASTLSDPDYLAYCQKLAERGFEITWHGATMESSDRQRTVQGLELFRELFGHYPVVHVNHGQNRENLYWGHKRYQFGPLRLLFRLRSKDQYDGEDASSPYYWADLAEKHCRFVRNLTFFDINTLKKAPHMVYRLRSTPGVNYWFATSDAPNGGAFKRVVTPATIDRLEREGGICILSTHLGKGFVVNGRVDPEIEATLRYLAGRPGWFVPVSELLQTILDRKGDPGYLRRDRLLRLELAYAMDKIRGLPPAPAVRT